MGRRSMVSLSAVQLGQLVELVPSLLAWLRDTSSHGGDLFLVEGDAESTRELLLSLLNALNHESDPSVARLRSILCQFAPEVVTTAVRMIVLDSEPKFIPVASGRAMIELTDELKACSTSKACSALIGPYLDDLPRKRYTALGELLAYWRDTCSEPAELACLCGPSLLGSKRYADFENDSDAAAASAILDLLILECELIFGRMCVSSKRGQGYRDKDYFRPTSAQRKAHKESRSKAKRDLSQRGDVSNGDIEARVQQLVTFYNWQRLPRKAERAHMLFENYDFLTIARALYQRYQDNIPQSWKAIVVGAASTRRGSVDFRRDARGSSKNRRHDRSRSRTSHGGKRSECTADSDGDSDSDSSFSDVDSHSYKGDDLATDGSGASGASVGTFMEDEYDSHEVLPARMDIYFKGGTSPASTSARQASLQQRRSYSYGRMVPRSNNSRVSSWAAPRSPVDRVIDELIDTEQHYCDCLEELWEFGQDAKTIARGTLGREAQSKLGLTLNETEVVFGRRLHDVISLSKTLLAHLDVIDLVRTEPENPQGRPGLAADAMLAVLPDLHNYAPYVSSHSGLHKVIKGASEAIRRKLKRRPSFSSLSLKSAESKFKGTFEERWTTASMSSKRLGGQNILSVLIMPVQRVPRYELLFNDLVKKLPESHPAYDKVVHVAEVIKTMTIEIDEAIRRHEKLLGLLGDESLVPSGSTQTYTRKGSLKDVKVSNLYPALRAELL